QRDARVREAAGVDDRDVEVALLDAVDQRALVIRLERVELEAEARRRLVEPGVDLVQRLPAVDRRFAGPEEVQVRALEHEDTCHDGTATSSGAAAEASPVPPSDTVASDGRPASTSPATRSTSASGTSARTVT